MHKHSSKKCNEEKGEKKFVCVFADTQQNSTETSVSAIRRTKTLKSKWMQHRKFQVKMYTGFSSLYSLKNHKQIVCWIGLGSGCCKMKIEHAIDANIQYTPRKECGCIEKCFGAQRKEYTQIAKMQKQIIRFTNRKSHLHFMLHIVFDKRDTVYWLHRVMSMVLATAFVEHSQSVATMALWLHTYCSRS